MSKTNALSTSLVLAGLFITGPAWPALIYEQPPLLDIPGEDRGDGAYSSMDGGTQNADDFVLGGRSQITGLRWWGAYNASAPDADAFILRVIADDNGDPNALASVWSITYQADYSGGAALTRTADGTVAGGLPVYRYDLVLDNINTFLPPFDLNDGAYYFSVMNDPEGAQWFWIYSSQGVGSIWTRSADGDSWTSAASSNLAFRVDGIPVTTVPVPGALWLFGPAVAATLRLKRRWKA